MNFQNMNTAVFKVQKFDGERCERCWNYFNEIDLTDHLCPRCHEIVEELNEKED